MGYTNMFLITRFVSAVAQIASAVGSFFKYIWSYFKTGKTPVNTSPIKDIRSEKEILKKTLPLSEITRSLPNTIITEDAQIKGASLISKTYVQIKEGTSEKEILKKTLPLSEITRSLPNTIITEDAQIKGASLISKTYVQIKEGTSEKEILKKTLPLSEITRSLPNTIITEDAQIKGASLISKTYVQIKEGTSEKEYVLDSIVPGVKTFTILFGHEKYSDAGKALCALFGENIISVEDLQHLVSLHTNENYFNKTQDKIISKVNGVFINTLSVLTEFFDKLASSYGYGEGRSKTQKLNDDDFKLFRLISELCGLIPNHTKYLVFDKDILQANVRDMASNNKEKINAEKSKNSLENVANKYYNHYVDRFQNNYADVVLILANLFKRKIITRKDLQNLIGSGSQDNFKFTQDKILILVSNKSTEISSLFTEFLGKLESYYNDKLQVLNDDDLSLCNFVVYFSGLNNEEHTKMPKFRDIKKASDVKSHYFIVAQKELLYKREEELKKADEELRNNFDNLPLSTLTRNHTEKCKEIHEKYRKIHESGAKILSARCLD